MATPQLIVKGASKGFFPLLKFMLTKGLLYLVFAIILISAITKSIDQKSVNPFLEEVGGRLIVITGKINDYSKQIIEGQYEQSNFWYKSSTIMGLLFSILIVYIWLKILYSGSKHFITGDTSRSWANMLIAIILFILIQIITSLFFIASEINIGYEITPKEAVIMPIIAFINLIKAIPIIIYPISETASKTADILGKTGVDINNTNLSS